MPRTRTAKADPRKSALRVASLPSGAVRLGDFAGFPQGP